MFKWPLIASIFLTFSGPSTIALSPQVDAHDGKMRQLPLNAETVRVAKRASYNSKQLPAVFLQNAGDGGSGNGARPVPGARLDKHQGPVAMATRIPEAVTPGAHKVGAGDVLILANQTGGNTVEKLSSLLAAQNSRLGYTVQDDGVIVVPDVRRVQLAGLTFEEVEAQLFQRFVQGQINPIFGLQIDEFDSAHVPSDGATANPAVAPIILLMKV